MDKQNLLDMIFRKKYEEYREATEELQPADLARILDQMDKNNRLVAFRLLKKDVATEAFAYMDPDIRMDMVEGFTDAELMRALERMSLEQTHLEQTNLRQTTRQQRIRQLTTAVISPARTEAQIQESRQSRPVIRQI